MLLILSDSYGGLITNNFQNTIRDIFPNGHMPVHSQILILETDITLF